MATTLHGDRIAIPTSASNPSSPAEGHMYYNSTDGTIKFYDGTIWISTNLIPIINSVGGTIYSGTQTTVTLNVSKTTDDVDIQWKEGSTLLATTTGASVSSGSISVSVPSQVYGQSQGDTISATVINADGTASNTGQWTVQELPTGGSINTYSGYRSHTFTSSGTFNTNGASFSVDALIVAGGGGGGVDAAAGAGAGGAINLTSTSLNGSYPISIGGGGAGRPGPSDHGPGNRGGATSALGYTANGGGAPQGWNSSPTGMQPGGSGAGQAGNAGGSNPGGIGTGTPGQGNPGGSWGGGQPGGGGGATQAGYPGSSSYGLGGNGITVNYRSGSNVKYASGGSGGVDIPGGKSKPSASNTDVPFQTAEAGQPSSGANTGHGGHGGNHNNVNGGNGGSGIVIIKYQIP